jgi:FkbH-like protein
VTDEQIAAVIADDCALSLQIRLLDAFGDNGIIAIVYGGFEPNSTRIALRTWLMSCRVLGRQMEQETLNLVVAEAQRLGATHLLGTYRPTAKNGMVREHYDKLGFTLLDTAADGTTTWELALTDWAKRPTHIDSRQAGAAAEQVPA